jgi:hypothetical protein
LAGWTPRCSTAFDYEFWLRLFKAYPGPQLAHVPDVQALSRLHAEGITLRMREQVATGRHAGRAPPHRADAPMHWLLTHVGEALAACPFDADVDAVRSRLLALADDADAVAGARRRPPSLSAPDEGASRLAARCGPEFAADVQPDGWAPQVLTLRVKQPGAAAPPAALRLWGRHASPVGARCG